MAKFCIISNIFKSYRILKCFIMLVWRKLEGLNHVRQLTQDRSQTCYFCNDRYLHSGKPIWTVVLFACLSESLQLFIESEGNEYIHMLLLSISTLHTNVYIHKVFPLYFLWKSIAVQRPKSTRSSKTSVYELMNTFL